MKIQPILLQHLQCKCKICKNSPIPVELLENSEKLLKQLRSISIVFNSNVIIHSAIRCKSHNTFVNGALHSYHMQALACDISIAGIKSNALLNKLLNYCIEYRSDINMIIMYDKFVHIDLRPGKFKVLNYSTKWII